MGILTTKPKSKINFIKIERDTIINNNKQYDRKKHQSNSQVKNNKR